MTPKKTTMMIVAACAAVFVALPVLAVDSVPGVAVDETTIDTSGVSFYGDDWYKCYGIKAYAKKPFRYKVFDRNGSSLTVLAPVDTTMMDGAITAGAIEYPVILTLDVAMDSIRFVPASSDSVWYQTVWK